MRDDHAVRARSVGEVLQLAGVTRRAPHELFALATVEGAVVVGRLPPAGVQDERAVGVLEEIRVVLLPDLADLGHHVGDVEVGERAHSIAR